MVNDVDFDGRVASTSTDSTAPAALRFPIRKNSTGTDDELLGWPSLFQTLEFGEQPCFFTNNRLDHPNNNPTIVVVWIFSKFIHRLLALAFLIIHDRSPKREKNK